MRKLFIIAISIGFIQIACNQTKTYQEGALTLHDSTASAGHNVSITYNKSNGVLAGKEQINGILYYYAESTIYANDLGLKSNSDSLLTTTFTLPDSAQAYALLFSSDDTKDSNSGKGYIFPAYDGDTTVQGAYAAMSKFYRGIGPYLLKTDWPKDSTLALIEKEFNLHPVTKKNWDWKQTYFYLLADLDKEKAKQLVGNALKDSLATETPSEETLKSFVNIYGRALDNANRSDSLQALSIKHYPKGDVALRKKINPLFDVEKEDSLSEGLKKIKESFPTEVTDRNSMISYLYNRLAKLYADQGNFEAMKQYADSLSKPLFKASVFNGAAWELAEKREAFNLADSLSSVSIEIVETQKAKPTQKPTYRSDREWQEIMQRSYGMYMDTYAFISAQQGNYPRALTLQKKAIEASKGNQPDINKRYVKYELKAGSADTALAKATQWIKDGKSTAKMDSLLQKAYTQTNGTDQGFDKYVAKIEAEAEKKLREKLVAQQLNKPAPDFNLPDLDGEQISLADLKGKIIILDFWATWCGPCKVSFPGMQKAVEKFQGDEDVVFLFINTWQQEKPEDRYQKVASFIQKNEYPFKVLMDQKIDDENSAYQMVKDYDINAIPTKIVIDGEGKILFKSMGANSNVKKQVNKISTMIDIAKS